MGLSNWHYVHCVVTTSLLHYTYYQTPKLLNYRWRYYNVKRQQLRKMTHRWWTPSPSVQYSTSGSVSSVQPGASQPVTVMNVPWTGVVLRAIITHIMLPLVNSGWDLWQAGAAAVSDNEDGFVLNEMRHAQCARSIMEVNPCRACLMLAARCSFAVFKLLQERFTAVSRTSIFQFPTACELLQMARPKVTTYGTQLCTCLPRKDIYHVDCVSSTAHRAPHVCWLRWNATWQG